MATSKSARGLLPVALFLTAFLVVPLSGLLVRSASGPAGLGNYEKVICEPRFRDALGHSLTLSLAVAAGACLLSCGPAWCLAQEKFRGKGLVRAAFVLPSSFSGVLVGFLAVLTLGRVGFVPKLSQHLFGVPLLQGTAYQPVGLCLAYLYFEVPRATLALEAAMEGFDTAWLRAARCLGASRAQRFALVWLPVLWPGLLNAFALTFVVSLGSFGAALILTRRFSVLPLELFNQFMGADNFALADAMGVVLLGLATVVLGASGAVSARFGRGLDQCRAPGAHAG